MKHLTCLFLILISIHSYSQIKNENLARKNTVTNIKREQQTILNLKESDDINGPKIRMKLNTKSIFDRLNSFTGNNLRSRNEIVLPATDGNMKEYYLESTSLLDEGFKRAFPDLQAYRIISRDDPTITGSLVYERNKNISVVVFHNHGMYSIVPEKNISDSIYLISEEEITDFDCGTVIDESAFQLSQKKSNFRSAGNFPNGALKRNYRMAIMTTGEYAITHGGTVSSATAVIAAQIGALSELYNREMSVTFTLLTPKIFLNAATDPFSVTTDVNILLEQSRSTAKANWNLNQYDLAHTLHSYAEGTYGGGVAFFGLCSPDEDAIGPYKAGAWSSMGTTIYNGIGLIAHEVGHQFYMPHTFNGTGGSCTANIMYGVEIGSGNSIMAYDGSCNANQNYYSNTLFFHSTSINTSLDALSTLTCATTSTNANSPPVANANPCAISSFNIPKSTPFRLTGSATDINNDILSYAWEQADEDGAGTSTQGFIGAQAAASTIAPLFRTYDPTPVPYRYFPSLEKILSNNYLSDLEPLPTVSRSVNFNFFVRDNNANGGGTDLNTLQVNVTNTGPLSVSAPNGGESLTAGNTINVTWAVNGTNTISPTVNIKLSVDGGNNYTYPLVNNTPNDGSQSITLPKGIISTTRARIMVESNVSTCFVFFDISNSDFSIISSCNAPITKINFINEIIADSGSVQLNLGLTNNVGIAISTITATLSNTDLPTNLVFLNGTPASCVVAGNSPFYDLYHLSVSISGNYTISHNVFPLVLNLYRDDFLDGGCINHVTSSATRPSGSGSVTASYSITAYLEAGKNYFLMLSGFSADNPPPPVNYSITFPTKPTGTIIYNGVLLPSSYSYTYMAVNTANNIIRTSNSSSNFTNLPPGSYEVYGVTYFSGTGTNPFPSNPSTWVGMNFNTWLADSTCKTISSNKKPIMVKPGCTNPNSLAVVNGVSNSVSLNWVSKTGITYTVQYRINGTSTWNTASTTIGFPPYSLSNLQAGATYQWQVASNCNNVFVAGPDFINTCTNPSNLSVPIITNVSGYVQWTTTLNHTYSLQYRVNGSSTWITASTNITAVPYILSNLMSSTTYQWQIAANCNNVFVSGPNFTTECALCIYPTQVVTKVILGGAYFPAGDTMSTALRAMGLLPTKCPYDTTQLINTLPSTMVDWVRIDLVDTLTGDTTYASQCACLLRNGSIQNFNGDTILTYPNLTKSIVSLRINHRNHLSARSRGLANIPGTNISFDYRTGTNLYIDPAITGIAFHNIGQPELFIPSGGSHPSRYTLWPGDANADRLVKYQGSGNDRGLILSAVGGTIITSTLTGYHPADFNLNGQVKYQGSLNDRGIVLSSIGGSVITKVAKAHD